MGIQVVLRGDAYAFVQSCGGHRGCRYFDADVPKPVEPAVEHDGNFSRVRQLRERIRGHQSRVQVPVCTQSERGNGLIQAV